MKSAFSTSITVSFLLLMNCSTEEAVPDNCLLTNLTLESSSVDITYDNQNRWSTITINESGSSESVVYTYVYETDKVTITGSDDSITIYTLNSSGAPSTGYFKYFDSNLSEEVEKLYVYEYTNNLLTKIMLDGNGFFEVYTYNESKTNVIRVEDSDGITQETEYGNVKNPTYGQLSFSDTSLWALLSENMPSRTVITDEIFDFNFTFNYTYQTNNKGFPVSRSMSGDLTENTTYSYTCD